MKCSRNTQKLQSWVDSTFQYYWLYGGLLHLTIASDKVECGVSITSELVQVNVDTLLVV